MKKCDICDLNYDDNQNFCNRCGNTLSMASSVVANNQLISAEKKCVKCNITYGVDKKFCEKCGTPLTLETKAISKVDAKIMVFEEKLKENQLNIDLLTEYAQFLYDHSEYKETTFILFRILAINDNNKLANNLLFSCYQELKQYQDAVEIGEKLLIKNAKDITLLERLAILAEKLKQQEKVYIYSNKIIEIDSDNIFALSSKAHILLDRNKISEVLPICTKLIFLGQNDRLILIYGGIDKVLHGNFNKGIQNFDGILTIPNDERNNIHSNRCRLYWTYCLCNINSELIEIERKFNQIDFDILKKIPFEFDEEIAVKIISCIINRNLEKIENTESVCTKISDLVRSTIESFQPIFTEKSNNIISESYYNIALKQKEFGLNEDALISINKAFYLTPKELRYSDYKVEIQRIVDSINAKHERNNIFKIISIASVILIIVFSVRYYLKLKEDNEWSSSKKSNTIVSLKDYLNKYPDGKYEKDAKERVDEILWTKALQNNTYEGYKLYADSSYNRKYVQQADSLEQSVLWHNGVVENSYEAYQRYIELFPNGKYSDKANKIVDEKLYQKIKTQGTEADYKLYLNRFPEGKHKTQVTEMIDDCNWNSIKNSNSKSDFGNYINNFPNGKYIQKANNMIEKINYNELHINDWAIGWWKSGENTSNERFLRIEDSKSCTYGSFATMYYGTYTIEGSVLKFNAEKFVKNEVVKVQSTFNGGGISYQYNDPLKTHTESSETASDYQANFNIDFENKTFELDGYVYKKSD